MTKKLVPTIETIVQNVSWDKLTAAQQKQVVKEFGKDWPKSTGRWSYYKCLRTDRKYWTQEAAPAFKLKLL